MNTPQAANPKRTAPLIPVAESREIEFSDLAPAELDSFFGGFFADTVHAELAQ